MFKIQYKCNNCSFKFIKVYEKGEEVIDSPGDKRVKLRGGMPKIIYCPNCDSSNLAILGRYVDKLVDENLKSMVRIFMKSIEDEIDDAVRRFLLRLYTLIEKKVGEMETEEHRDKT